MSDSATCNIKETVDRIVASGKTNERKIANLLERKRKKEESNSAEEVLQVTMPFPSSQFPLPITRLLPFSVPNVRHNTRES